MTARNRVYSDPDEMTCPNCGRWHAGMWKYREYESYVWCDCGATGVMPVSLYINDAWTIREAANG